MPLIVMISHNEISLFLTISTRYLLFPWQDLRQCREQLEMCKEQGKERTAAAVEKRLEDGGWHGETRRNMPNEFHVFHCHDMNAIGMGSFHR
jgi:hypothetical protein